MADDQRVARSLAEEWLHAWVDGDADAFSELCSPDVRWWLPGESGEPKGPVETLQVLTDLLRAAGAPVRVDALIAADDGRTVVVEVSVPTGHDDASGPITSILTIEAGSVVAGRTYFDVVTFASSGR